MSHELAYTVVSLGLLTALSCFLIIMQIVTMRTLNARRAKTKETFRQKWRPVLLDVVEGKSVQLHPNMLTASEIPIFLTEWNRLMDVICGDAATRLRAMPRELGICDYIQQHIDSKIQKIAACCIVAAGNLREKELWPRLVPLLQHRSACNSMLSARAIVQISASEAVPIFLPVAIARGDWPATWTSKLLFEAGEAASTKPVADAVRVAQATESVEQLLHLIPLFSTVEKTAAAVLLRDILRAPLSDKIVSRSLQSLSDKEFADLARQYLHYPRWHVRVHAAATLGRLGDVRDISPLTKMLTDKHWWVRYRAAHALNQLNGMTEQKLREIRVQVDDHYARDIIDYVLMERKYA